MYHTSPFSPTRVIKFWDAKDHQKKRHPREESVRQSTKDFKTKNTAIETVLLDAPTEIRTPVLTLKGSCPGPLDDGGERKRFYQIMA